MEWAYDIHRSYEENYDHGPFLAPAQPASSPSAAATATKQFLGLPVNSRLGIAAGLLLNSRWIDAYARRGFDILTYKTVRSSARPSYPPPNWVFLKPPQPEAATVEVADPPDHPAEVSSAVCFGMPSKAPAIWQADVARAKQSLLPGQVLVVSVVATPTDPPNPDQIADDFAICAAWAEEAGADVVEANFSCPNVCSPEGSVYLDASFSGSIALRIRQQLRHCPLLLKIGRFPSTDALKHFLLSVNGLAAGVTLVNGLSKPVLLPDGSPAFGPRFRVAGVLGRAIHQPSRTAVQQAAAIIEKEHLDLSIAAVGGVSSSRDAADFFDAGAEAVLAGSSPMYQPDLAWQLKKEHPEW